MAIGTIAGRTVTTLHGRLDLPDLQLLYREFSDVPLVSISRDQRRPMPPVNWAGMEPGFMEWTPPSRAAL